MGSRHAGTPRQARTARRPWAILGALLVLLAAVLAAASAGTLSIPLGTTLSALAGGLSGRPLEGLEGIVWNLRIPRVAFAVLVGGTLAASGAALQGLFRNPLADPYLMGVASGASFGATLAVVLGGSLAAAFAPAVFTAGGTALVPPLAFAGAFLAVLATVALARGSGRGSTGLVLAGVVVGSIFTSASTYLMLRDADRLRAVFSWSLGNLSLASWAEVAAVLPYAVAGLAGLLVLARALDALQLGEDTARTLGVPVERVRLAVIAAASLATAAAVSYAGPIGFVGLVAPHVMRRLGAAGHRALIVSSALAGGALLVVADLGARTLTRPAELPVGVVTTLIGGPFFLWLLRRGAR
ncbi:MAG TPA: iron ABC transporter permease [Deinococcales bacterium]|nr:iron ABC transporter permease [Deinococcales bacterium]